MWTLGGLSRWVASGVLGAVLVAAGMPVKTAHAVIIEADAIEADGVSSTIDLWFFSFSADVVATLQIDDLGGPPVVGADTELIIYEDDGTFSTVFASSTGGGPAQINTSFLAGSYVGVVANAALLPNEFGPFQTDAALAVGGYQYEFAASGADSELSFNCVLSGRLTGGYDTRVLGSNTCQLPPVGQVSEPGTLPLLAVALMIVGCLGLRRTIA